MSLENQGVILLLEEVAFLLKASLIQEFSP